MGDKKQIVRSWIAVCILVFYYNFFVFSQTNSDSLLIDHLEHLKAIIHDSLDVNGNARNHSLKYLREAKKNQDKTRIAEAFYFLYLSNNDNSAHAYLDSLISISIENDYFRYLSIAYQEKGKLMFDSGEFDSSLEYYLLALDNIEVGQRPNVYYIITHNIAIIKDLIGQKLEALKIYRQNFNFYQEDGIENSEIENYLVNIFALSHSFTENGILDSASYYNSLGIKEATKYNKPRHKAKFILGEGYNLYYKNDLSNSYDSILKAIPLLKQTNDKFNLATGYLYAAKILSIRNDEYSQYLKIADSIISNENRVYPQFIEIYDLLYQAYKEGENSEKQLFYLEKLIEYDKEIRKRYKNLYSTIIEEYDQPRLLEEKEKIIAELEDSKKSWSIFFITITILFLGSVSVAIHHYRRRRKYKKRFENLLKQGGIRPGINKDCPKSELNLSDDLVAKVLANIELFEKNEGYLNRDLSLTKLAELVETNSNYLSRIINHKKGKNYSSYINDLRIEFVLEELLRNKVMRKYTIKAIAHEIGFRNAESFSNAFFKRVGLHPSFYIKELNKSVC